MKYRENSDRIDRAQKIVASVESAARKQDGEAVLDQLDDLFELSGEFPDVAFEVCLRLTRSQDPTVRTALATRGIPQAYNRLSESFAEHLTEILVRDPNPRVVDAMRASLVNFATD